MKDKPKEIAPYLSSLKKQKTQRRLFIRLSIVLVCTGLVLIGSMWLVVNFPFFHFKEIKVNLSDNLDKSQILSAVQSQVILDSYVRKILGPSHFFIWPNSITGANLKIPQISKVNIEKKYFSRALILDVVERKPTGVWCEKSSLSNRIEKADNSTPTLSEDNPDELITLDEIASARCFFFDSAGIIFMKTATTGGNLVKVVSDYSKRILTLNSKILPDRFLPNLFSVFSVIDEAKLNVEEIILRDLTLQEITVKINSGPEIYFSLRHPSNSYLLFLKSVIKNQNLSKLKYIDLRVENRAYTN
ncbi:MAG: hypothetical protein WCX12_00410 [Candidatus Paceibacterota bacterium]|jgi:cell division septal protein FtsQ